MPAITDQNWRDYVEDEDLLSMRKYGGSVYLPTGDSIYLPKGEGLSSLAVGEAIYLPKGESVEIEGGILPLLTLLPLIFGGIAAAGTAAGAVAGPVLAAKKNEEEARHNEEMERIARGASIKVLEETKPEKERINSLIPKLTREIIKVVKRVNNCGVKNEILPYILPGLLYYHLKKKDAGFDENPFGKLGQAFSQIAKARKGKGLMEIITGGIGKIANFISQNKDTISNVAETAGKVAGTATSIAKDAVELSRIKAQRGNGLSPYPTYSEADFGSKKSNKPAMSKEEENVANYIVSGEGFHIFN